MRETRTEVSEQEEEEEFGIGIHSGESLRLVCREYGEMRGF